MTKEEFKYKIKNILIKLNSPELKPFVEMARQREKELREKCCEEIVMELETINLLK